MSRPVHVLGATLASIYSLLAAPAVAGDRTTSPDGAHAVVVEGGRMFVERLDTHRRIQIGRGLPGPCCELVTALPGPGWQSDVELHDGAFWTRRDLRWTKGRRFVLVRMGDSVWFLSMDGRLRGDV